MITFNVLFFSEYPIDQQLYLEETLFHFSRENWLLINQGAAFPTVVMGVSRKKEEDLYLSRCLDSALPIWRRFTGGGTVVVDQQTLFISWIVQQRDCYVGRNSQKLMEWTYMRYRSFFSKSAFTLCENDYLLEGRKCGGNAQYIRLESWLHHTSFLWNYSPELMSHLRIPVKQPAYRNNRSHTQFLTTLSHHTPLNFSQWVTRAREKLAEQFILQERELSSLSYPSLKHFRTTRVS